MAIHRDASVGHPVLYGQVVVGAEEGTPGLRQRIAAAVRRAKATHRLTQAGLARRLGEMRGEPPHGRDTIGRWERGASLPDLIDLVNVLHLAEMSGCEVLGTDEPDVVALRREIEALKRAQRDRL